MKKVLFIIAAMASLLAAGSGGARAQSQDQNYVLTRTYLNEDRTKYLDNIQYFDGIGRPSEAVARKVTPQGNDLVSLQEYDAAGRATNSWLPGTSATDGAFVDAEAIKAAAVSLNGDASPFSSTVYDNSPLDHVLEQYGPGSAWHSTGHSAKTAFMANDPAVDSLNCVVFQVMANTRANTDTLVSIMGTGYYVASTLHVVRSADEDGHATLSFTDRQGRLVLSRQIAMVGSARTFHDTYYIYDNAGNLTAVLPPLAADAMIPSPDEGGWMCSNANFPALRQYAYLYCYDGRNRVRAKRLPGTDWTLYVYDSSDRVILTQDGNSRAKGEWIFTITDNMGRPCLEGKCLGGYAAYQSLNNRVYCTRTNATDNFKGYTVSGISLNTPSVLRANYYDNYDFIGQNGFDSSKVGFLPQAGYATTYANAKGKLTGEIVAENIYIPLNYFFKATYYDDKGRVIEHNTTDLMGWGGDFTAYDFTGKPTKRAHRHFSSRDIPNVMLGEYTYSYDGAGRLIDTKYSLNGATPVDIAHNTYDELGRLTGQRLGGTETSNTTYAYNVRSWMKSTSTPLFSETLAYDSPTTVASIPAFNGNVAEQSWSVASEGKQRGYAFAYDGLNRLTQAVYRDNGNAILNNVELNGYDKNGNILQIIRNGDTVNIFGDVLAMAYNGNQLTSVSDAGTPSTQPNSMEFIDNNTVGDDYAYDKNGNIVKDLNKNILSIQYNSLNLPDYIYFANGERSAFLYDYDGNKLYTNGDDGDDDDNTYYEKHYCEDMYYENWKLNRINLENGYGYISMPDGQFHFYQKDHLGNNRLVVNKNGTIEQVNHYYPYGMSFAEGTSTVDNAWKYNGKELDTTDGINLYDYSARQYDPALGRFTTIDPMAEKYYSISPYAYALNNPVRFVDPDGKNPWDVFPTIRMAAVDWGMYYNGASIIRGKEFGTTIREITNKDGSKGYTYYNATEGGVDFVDIPQFSNSVAIVHSHGNYDPELNKNGSGNGNNVFSDDDKLTSDESGLPSYVATSNGELQEYNPTKGEVNPNPISKLLPSDPKDPDRVNTVKPTDKPAVMEKIDEKFNKLFAPDMKDNKFIWTN